MKKWIFMVPLLLLAARTATAAEKIDAIENEIRIVLNRVSPSLVKVVAENHSKYVATGIALENALVITTSLVTRHPFERISVETIKGETIAARIAGQDPRSGLTLLRLDKKGLLPITQARQAEVGNWVALVGLFYDRFPSIFQGIISSLSENELILNAPVAPGSAGGAVVNKNGELLGIIRGSIGFSSSPDFTFKDPSASIVVSGRKNESGSLCYAIPVAQVRRIAEQLKTEGKVVPGWMGVTFSSDTTQVLDVIKDSPAAKAGIVAGDRIEEISGKVIASFRDITAALEFRHARERVSVTVNRAGKPLRLDVELGERRGQEPPPPFPEDYPEIPEGLLPQLAGQLAEMPELPELATALPRVRNYVIEFGGARQLGVDVMEITADLARKFAVKEGYGLLVSRVNEGTAAKKAGLKAGDIIVRAKGSPVRSASDLRTILNGLKEKEAVLIELYRDGHVRKFSLLPDPIGKKVWDIRKFSEKMESLKENISDEARMFYQDELRKMQMSKEKAQAGLQKQKEQSLLKLQEQSKKMAAELKKLQAEKDKLAAAAQKKYAEELKKIQEELDRISDKLKSEAGKAAAGDEPDR
jgi:S1-C subfamily serine protease